MAAPGTPTTEAEHLRQHRPGRPSRIDADAELRAFILARIEGATFPQLAREVAAAFPPDRRVAKSAIHRWWQDHQATAATCPDPPDEA